MRDPDATPSDGQKESPPASAAERLARLFDGNPGAHGEYGAPVFNGTKWEIKSTARTPKKPATDAHWQQHLDDKRGLGVIPIRPDGTCSWGSIDVDKYDDTAELIEIVNRVIEAKLPLVPCRSKSGGLHLFIFLTEPVLGTVVQAALRDASARLGIAGSEIFPKQTLDEERATGNWITMPYGPRFGGKLCAQAGLKRDGNGGLTDMTAEEFVAAAEAARVAPEKIGAMAGEAGPRPAARGRANGAAPAGAPFADGPPCLQMMAINKVERGGQSNFLMTAGTYYKRADPGNWEARLMEASQLYLDPPGTPEGLAQVVKSLRKKEYSYLCKAEPMCSHCDSALCRTRPFGVGAAGNFPRILAMQKRIDDPPAYTFTLDRGSVVLDGDEIYDYKTFAKACLLELNVGYHGMRHNDWMDALNAAMATMTVTATPPELGHVGQFRGLVKEFCTNRNKGNRAEDVLSGRPWEDNEKNRHVFRIEDLRKFLSREVRGGDLLKKVTKDRWVTKQIKDLGGDVSVQLKVGGRNVRVCWVPQMEPLPELPVEPLKDHPV